MFISNERFGVTFIIENRKTEENQIMFHTGYYLYLFLSNLDSDQRPTKTVVAGLGKD